MLYTADITDAFSVSDLSFKSVCSSFFVPYVYDPNTIICLCMPLRTDASMVKAFINVIAILKLVATSRH
jgi:hypothetical protein